MARIQLQIYQFALELQTNHITYLHLSLLIYQTSMISTLSTLMVCWGQNEITNKNSFTLKSIETDVLFNHKIILKSNLLFLHCT